VFSADDRRDEKNLVPYPTVSSCWSEAKSLSEAERKRETLGTHATSDMETTIIIDSALKQTLNIFDQNVS